MLAPAFSHPQALPRNWGGKSLEFEDGCQPPKPPDNPDMPVAGTGDEGIVASDLDVTQRQLLKETLTAGNSPKATPC